MATHLTQNEHNALKEFSSLLMSHFPDNYLYSCLFGSKSRGDAHKDSDLDVVVILKDVNYKTKCAVIDLAYEELLKTDVDISPLIFSQNDYERQRLGGYPIVQEIERDKVMI
jgi:predicted nucleotidyltransferase